MPEIRLPLDGVSDRTAERKQPANVYSPGNGQNVVARKSDTGRKVLTKRPALRKLFQTRLGTGPIQGLRSITHSSAVTTFTLGVGTTLDATNALAKVSGGAAASLAFNALMLATSIPSLQDAYLIDGSGGQARARRESAAALQNVAAAAGFPNSTPASWCALHPSGTMAAIGYNYTASSQNRLLVVFVEPQTGNLIGSKLIAPDGEDTGAPTNQAVLGFCWTDRALWLARGTQFWYVATPLQGGKARLWLPETLTATPVTIDAATPLTACQRVTAMTCYTLEGVTSLLAAFEGATGAGQYLNPTGTITIDAYARHFRAGVFKFTETAETTAYQYRLVVDAEFAGGAPGAADPFVEVSVTTPVQHYSMRFSQWLARAPRGCLPNQIAAAVDGSFAVTFTNQGYGPNSGYHPDGSGAAYTTVAKFNAAGELLWEADSASNIPGEQGGKRAGVGTLYPCDIPNEDGGNVGTTNEDGPALRALAIDQDGTVFCGGRVNAGLFSVFAFGSGSGQLIARQRLETGNVLSTYDPATAGASGRGVCRGGLGIDGDDGNVVVAGRRNNTWDSTLTVTLITQRPYAMLWKLSQVDLDILWGFDVVQDETEVNPTALAVGEGIGFVGTAAFADS